MKTTPIAVLALTMVLSTLRSDALNLQPGQSIGIDFGASPPTNHFNQWDPSSPGAPANGLLTTVVDTNGATLSGVAVSFGGDNAVSTMVGETQDLSHDTGFNVSNIEDGVTGYNLTMSFTGLLPGQAFTLSLVSSYSSRNIGTEFAWGSVSLTTDSTSTTGGTLAHFANIVADANGRITLAAIGHDSLHAPSNWGAINAALLTAQAIPEPSVWVLSLVGMAGMVLIQRRRPSRANGKDFCKLL